MNGLNWAGLGLIGVAVGAIALSNLSPSKTSQPVNAQPSVTQSPIPTPSQQPLLSPEDSSPQRLAIKVSVAEPIDLKVNVGDVIKAGQLIADRSRERSRFNSQKQQLTLSLQRLQSYQPFPPTPPQAVPAVKALPPNSYLEHEAEGEKAKSAIASVESQIETKKVEIAYLKELPNLDPIILEHEEAKLKELKLKHTEAVKDYQLAVGKLQSAKNQQAYQEYQASITSAQRVESINQARANYERQLAEYQQRLTDREFQITQVKTKLNEVENEIASLSVVKSPYDGTVRRIKWLGQAPDGALTAELTLMVREQATGNRLRRDTSTSSVRRRSAERQQ